MKSVFFIMPCVEVALKGSFSYKNKNKVSNKVKY